VLVVITRARKDAKAVEHAIQKEVLSLGGSRYAENLDLSSLKNKIPIFIFGKEDKKLAEDIEKEISKITPIYKIVILNKKSVRNARLSEIIFAFETAKAELRLSFNFQKKTFIFTNSPQVIKNIHPDYDAYFILGKEFVKNIKEVFGIEVKEGNLILRKHLNEEEIYTPGLKAIIRKTIGKKPEVVKHYPEVKLEEIDLKKLIEANKNWLLKLEEIAIVFLKENTENREEIGVPFSGGKDSTAVLILAKKAFKNVKALYVKVSHEFPYTEEYVKYVCEKLDVEFVKTEVKFDVGKFGMPTHENRWCTAVKLQALERIATPVLIVGDREAESRARRRRKEKQIRVHKELYPIKYWSGAMVQLYVLLNEIPLHSLYYTGFYRLGCTICPSLSEWEHHLLKKVSLAKTEKFL
jgi:3'-phosphoadenosine 5'-phosphosulfate sulfotransferase (PAPS reductase)/FAD synthetase/3'-phosphoadenosine 5'-phosphosulfate sulfotransferase